MTEKKIDNPVSDEARDEHFRQHADAIVARLNEAIARFFRTNRPTVHYEKGNDPVIQLDGMTIEIRPGVHQQPRIGNRIVESPAFDIITYKHHPATLWQPEDVEDVPLATERNPTRAAEVALVEWFKIEAGNWFENAGILAALEE